jgi:hypothetical protein
MISKPLASFLAVTLLVPIVGMIQPSPVLAARCTTDRQVRTQSLELVNQVRTRVTAYQAQLQTRFDALNQSLAGLENRDSQIRGEWQGNADASTIGALIEEATNQQVAVHLGGFQQDADSFERDVEQLLSRSFSVAATQCARVQVSQSLRLRSPRTKTYSGSTAWRDGWGTVMARYRVRATASVSVSSSSLRLITTADSTKDPVGVTKYAAKVSVYPQVKVQASVSSQRKDRRSVTGRATIGQKDDKIVMTFAGETPVVVR